MEPNKHSLSWILRVSLILVVLAGGTIAWNATRGANDRNSEGGGYGGKNSQKSIASLDPNAIPKFIQTSFVDLTPITSISKFRSLAGHDFSNNGETCRSMKHYFDQNIDASYKPASFEGHSIPAPPDGVHDITIVSPVDGTIQQIDEERLPVGKQFYIVPDAAKDYTIRLFHVFPLSGIAAGQHVTAGQQLGVIAKGQGTDISVEYGLGTKQNQYISYFDVLPDSLFAAFTARGVSSRDELIISKVARDQESVGCNQGGDQSFTLPSGYDNEQDYVRLSGYAAPKRDKK